MKIIDRVCERVRLASIDAAPPTSDRVKTLVVVLPWVTQKSAFNDFGENQVTLARLRDE